MVFNSFVVRRRVCTLKISFTTSPFISKNPVNSIISLTRPPLIQSLIHQLSTSTSNIILDLFPQQSLILLMYTNSNLMYLLQILNQFVLWIWFIFLFQRVSWNNSCFSCVIITYQILMNKTIWLVCCISFLFLNHKCLALISWFLFVVRSLRPPIFIYSFGFWIIKCWYCCFM